VKELHFQMKQVFFQDSQKLTQCRKWSHDTGWLGNKMANQIHCQL